MECTSSREKIELQRQQITSLRGRILTSSYQSQMNVSRKEPEMFILINHNFTIISLLHCANSKPKFRNQFMTQLTVRNKNCILRDNIMHIQSLHFNTFIISCEIRSDFPYQSPLIEMDQLLSLSVVGANAQCSVKFEL